MNQELINLINQYLSQGYTLSQIKGFLSSRYSAEDIEKAITEISKKYLKNLGPVIKELEKKYTKDDIKRLLVMKGYDEIIVNEMLQDKKDDFSQTLKKAIPFFILLILFMSVLGVAYYLIDSGIIFGEDFVALDSRLTTKNIYQGSDIEVELELTSGSDKEYPLKLEYYLKDKRGNVLVDDGSSLSMTSKKKDYENIYIPKTIAPGRYLLEIRATYSDGILTDRLDVFIEQETKQEDKTEIKKDTHDKDGDNVKKDTQGSVSESSTSQKSSSTSYDYGGVAKTTLKSTDVMEKKTTSVSPMSVYYSTKNRISVEDHPVMFYYSCQDLPMDGSRQSCEMEAISYLAKNSLPLENCSNPKKMFGVTYCPNSTEEIINESLDFDKLCMDTINDGKICSDFIDKDNKVISPLVYMNLSTNTTDVSNTSSQSYDSNESEYEVVPFVVYSQDNESDNEPINEYE